MERGNVLFIIFIAVALFTALGFAITDSGGSNMAVNDTNAKITSSEIVQMVEQLRTTVNRLEFLNDCDVTEISFAYDSNSDTTVDATDDYWNASAPDLSLIHI